MREIAVQREQSFSTRGARGWIEGEDRHIVLSELENEERRYVPWGIHVLTALHGLGAIACLVMALGSAISDGFRLGLVASPGSAIMIDFFGRYVWIFLVGIAALLTTLCYGSWKLRPWTRALTIVCYSIGVAGGLWEVSIGIRAGFLAAAINGAVVLYACTKPVREAYQPARAPR